MRNPKDKDEVIENCKFLITDTINFKDNEKPLHIEIGMGKGNWL